MIGLSKVCAIVYLVSFGLAEDNPTPTPAQSAGVAAKAGRLSPV
jgi:hypothetical protein